MKIGILTFHCAHNYGAVLQAYALQEYLRSKGYEVRIIDYRPKALVSYYKLFDVRYCLSLKTFLSKALLYPVAKKRAMNFDRFIQSRLQLEQICLDSSDNDYDVFVFGSDQIWNPHLLKGFDKVYFGDFHAALGRKCVAYAASMGKTSLTSYEHEFLENALKAFHAISVRESSLKKLLSPLTDKPISVVADPTFLLNRDYWENMVTRPKIHKPYVLVYQVVKDSNTLRIARHIAQQIGGEIVELKAVLSLLHQSPYQCASPEDFVSYFKYAACVVTTSFHGTAFSVIFQRPFYTLKLNTRIDARSEALLNQLALIDRMVDKNATVTFSEIDYSKVLPFFEKMRSASASFLTSSLEANDLSFNGQNQ